MKHIDKNPKFVRKKSLKDHYFSRAKHITTLFLASILSFNAWHAWHVLPVKAITAASVQAVSNSSYTVARGDTLWTIANKYGATTAELKRLNSLSSTVIYPGQVLKVPTGAAPSTKTIEYRVRSGDTLGAIAEQFGTTVSTIKSINGLNSNLIIADQILKIPASFVNYKVVSGDSLFSIAVRYGTTVAEIKLFNGLNSNTIYPGQTLHIPHIPSGPKVSYTTHTVKSGETSWELSKKYGIPQAELLKVNGLTTSSVLSVGQKLKIPVYIIPVKPTPGPQYGEYLDWWAEAQYVFPIGEVAIVRDYVTGRTFKVERTIGANHADCEPLTAADAATMKSIWGGNYSWVPRAVLVQVNGRKIAASVTSTPHGIQYIETNNFNGHFDIHFKNSTRHVDGTVDTGHQAQIRIAAGVK